MDTDGARGKALPMLSTTSSSSSQQDSNMTRRRSVDVRKSRVFSHALRSMSSSSMDSLLAPSKSTASHRKLQKTRSSSGSIIEKMHRRTSKDVSTSPPLADRLGSPIDQPLSSMDILQFGPLKADISLLKAKARAEYLVLTDQCLVKFGNAEAARNAFPQLVQTESSNGTTPLLPHNTPRLSASDSRLEIPLRSIVAAFNEEGSGPHFGIEIWWHSQWPRLAYCKTHLFFSLPKERNDWLNNILNACRTKLRKAPLSSPIPENVRTRINHIVAVSESDYSEGATQSLIFPVAKRVVGVVDKANVSEEPQTSIDGPSFYLVIGPSVCHFVETLRADCHTAPGELRMKVTSLGTITLSRFKASVASNEQRFMMSFSIPFGANVRLDLASIHYRHIIEALTKVDRILKPMWPQHLQQSIFDVKGLPPPLELTSGNDLGGLERSLEAYCTAFQVQIPTWTIDWDTPYQPTFRLMPLDTPYTPLQLLAVFRALRYNSYFKGISLRDTDLSSLYGKRDKSSGDAVVHTSSNGSSISEEHHDILAQAPILVQEIHALAFASASIRSIDLSDVLGLRNLAPRFVRTYRDEMTIQKMSSELVQPLIMLLQSQLGHCNSIALSGNPLAPSDVDELATVMRQEHVCLRSLDLSRCNLGDAGLSQIWTGLAAQGLTLDTIDTSDNQGTVRGEILRNTLRQMKSLTKLRIAGNARLDSEKALFDEAALNCWALQELDLSGIALNDATVDLLSGYLQTTRSRNLGLIRLNRCRLTGRQIAGLFRGMGQARRLTVHLSGNYLDEGIDDLCAAIACGYAPWSLFVQMIEFTSEASYIKLFKAFTVNKTIECLSLRGSSTPDAASNAACQAVSDFLSKNQSVRFLDISGYDAKLDEGRLGREFSKALSGLRTNTRLEHLRVRNQMLNINVGDLAEAISRNRTLHTLDCEDNGFNLSNFRHLIKHLHENTTIRHFSVFSDDELAKIKQKLAESAVAPTANRRSSIISRFKSDKSYAGPDHMLAQQLMDEWESVEADQRDILERNQRNFEESTAADTEYTSQLLADKDSESIFTAVFGGLALREYESRMTKFPSRAATPSMLPGLPSVPPTSNNGGRASSDTGARVARSFSTVSSEIALSPMTDGASNGSNLPTPPEFEGPTERSFGSGGYNRPEVVCQELQDNYDDADGNGVEESGVQMKTHRRLWNDTALAKVDEQQVHIGGGDAAAATLAHT
ncbi:hypothetical protein S40293_02078 [Stachybotrys chartarum IBT 40293]|nr:hypothetical protein S40293_02078 [Stachybotrys chartarum IBT 40293]